MRFSLDLVRGAWDDWCLYTDIMEELEYRELQESDFEALKSLHGDFFPVKYSDMFFANACKGVGLRGGQLYNLVAVQPPRGMSTWEGEEEEEEEERIVGFLLAQVFDASTAEDADLFFPTLLSPKRVCYVLTLGFIPEYRRAGLASLFILKLRNDMELDPYCGAVYLHVITTNNAALHFYSHNDFLCLRSLQGFYTIEEVDYDALIYCYYLNGYSAPAGYQWDKLMARAGSTVGRLWARLTCGAGAELGEGEGGREGNTSGIVTGTLLARADVVEKCGVVVSVTSSTELPEERKSESTALEE